MSAAGELITRILKDYKEGNLELPSLPESIFRIRKAISDNNNAVDIAHLVQMDPALTVRLIQVANSPFFKGVSEVRHVHGAICRLGLKTTRNIVTSFALQNVFAAQDPDVDKALKRLWQHSSQVAAISYVLARVTPHIDPDRALLGGAVHDIGLLPLYMYAEQQPHLITDPHIFRQLSRALRPRLGTMILSRWHFDKELAGIPAEVENSDYRPGEQANYIDVVIVAHIHALCGDGKNYNGPSLAEVASFSKLPLSRMGPDASIELVYEAREDIKLLSRMLNTSP